MTPTALATRPELEHAPPRDAHLELLERRVARHLEDSMATATRTAYARQWATFTSWADRHAVAALPAEPGTIAAYCADLFDAGASHSTIDQALAAIAAAHKVAGIDPVPTRSELVRSTRKGQRKARAVAQREAAPLTVGELRRVVVRIDTATTAGLRDRALLLIGFAGALRRSEIVALEVEDLTAVDDGLTIRVRRSKTDQEGQGATLAIPHGTDPDTCPVRALTAWLAHASIDTGPLFRAVTRHGTVGAALEGRAVARIVQRRVVAAGLDPSRYAGHSLRAGFVTTAAAAGATERAIAHQTRHSPTSSVLRRYIRHASPFTDNAVTQVGL